jgi:hypothetical protein
LDPMAMLKVPVVLLTSAFVPRLVLVCAGVTPARERQNLRNRKNGEKRSSVGRMTKHIIPSLFVDLSLLLEQPKQRQLVYQLVVCGVSDNSHRSQCLSPKQPPTGNNRQIGEHQTKGQARHKAEWANPSRYDDEGQNVGHENVGVEFDGVRHEAGGLSLMGLQPGQPLGPPAPTI